MTDDEPLRLEDDEPVPRVSVRAGPGELDLAGAWRVRHDPRDEGEAAGWWRGGESGGAKEWKEIVLPDTWRRVLGVAATGVAWLKRTVKVPAEWVRGGEASGPGGRGGRVWLRFEAVATDARVWVNGVEVGRHVGDWLPWHVEVTAALGGGEDARIVLRVDQMHAPRPAAGVLTENGHIGKGFHDVLSVQTAGAWDGVRLERTGPFAVKPGGVWAMALPRDESRLAGEWGVRVGVELEEFGPGAEGTLEVTLRDRDGIIRGVRRKAVRNEREAEVEIEIEKPRVWRPADPYLYLAQVRLIGADGVVSVERAVRVGCRVVRAGGGDGRRIVLNGEPVLVRGILHWGHEPRAWKPWAGEGAVRAEFERLKAMGFNAVCVCMWYPPERWYQIADEMGMLVWQEHPVWKSAMGDERVEEYRRLYEGYFKRDRGHPSVVIVSGACEHEAYNPTLARWWWTRSAEVLPDRLRQVQTAFFAWTDERQTDLHDEHVYESSGRWVKYLEDLDAELRRRTPKPFVMGETIIGTAWPDVAGVELLAREDVERFGPGADWWKPKGLEECAAYERWVIDRFGARTLERYKEHALRQNLAIRKYQFEALRWYAGIAGVVTNHVRDVPQARCGFKDDLQRWRFRADQTKPWLGDQAVLVRTPEGRLGFFGGSVVEIELGVSNFGGSAVRGPIEASVECGEAEAVLVWRGVCGAGEVRGEKQRLKLPVVDRATAAVVSAGAWNAWRLWVLPRWERGPAGVVAVDGLVTAEADREPTFEERKYSSGWGLEVSSWRRCVQEAGAVLPEAERWSGVGRVPDGARVVVSHALTAEVVEWLEAGGRVVWLVPANADGTMGGPGTRYVVTWGQCPLVPSGRGRWLEDDEADAVVDLLHADLTRRTVRAVAVEAAGIAGEVEPIVRMVFTHDVGVPTAMDGVFAANVGRGVLVASALDHSEDAGRWVLQRLIDRLMEGKQADGRLDAQRVREWVKKG